MPSPSLSSALLRRVQHYGPASALVLLGHVLFVLALLKGLNLVPLPTKEVVVMAQIVSGPIVAEPEPEPQPEPPPPPPKPVVQPKVNKPQPLAVRPKRERRQPAETAVQAEPEPAEPAPAVAENNSTAESSQSDSRAQAAPAAPKPDVVLKPQRGSLINIEGHYPPLSRRMGEEGTVVIQVLVNEQGQPAEVRVKKSSGYQRLDQAAISAVRAARFSPGSRNGKAEAMWFDLPIRFELRD